MTLSRHFYALDEVHAALQYSSTRNDRFETVFWCHELVSSGCASETISTLFESWLWYKGPFSLSWLSIAQRLSQQEVVESDILLAAYQLSWIPYSRRDHSLWNILVRTAQGDVPDRVTPKTPPYLPSSDANEVFLIRAIFQGKAYSAWWMSRHVTNERVWELLRWYVRFLCPAHSEAYLSFFTLLENYESLLGYRSEEYDVVIRCLAVLSVCLKYEQQEQSWQMLPEMEVGVQTAVEEWSRNGQRRYSIPIACLYGRCERGRMKWSESTVYQLGRIEQNIKGCPFWDDVLEEYQCEGTWTSDESREAFYDHYLTEVPDEWTKIEKRKSHGDGIIGPKDDVTLSIYAKRHFTFVSRMAWMATPCTMLGKSPLDIISLLPSPSPVTSEMIRPIRRKKII